MFNIASADNFGPDYVDYLQQVLQRGGFIAVGLFLIILVPRIVSNRYVSIISCITGIFFIVAFGVLNLLDSRQQKVLVYGMVMNVDSGYNVSINSDLRTANPAYIRIEKDSLPDRIFKYNFPFVVVSRDSPKCIEVAISSDNANAEGYLKSFYFPITEDDYLYDKMIIMQKYNGANGDVYMRAWREDGQSVVGGIVDVQPLGSGVTGCAPPKSASLNLGGLVGRPAFAQEKIDYRLIAKRLESDDPFVRRYARIELGDYGEEAFEEIEDLLRSDIYRLQLGAAIAVGNMSKDARKSVPQDIEKKLKNFSGSSDQSLRDAAQRALR